MSRRQQRMARCRYRHSTATNDGWIRGDNESPGILITASGQPTWKMICRGCDARSSAIPAAIAIGVWGLSLASVEWIEDRAGTVAYEPCIIPDCPDTPTEYHHFAPSNVFGAEADLWPCLPLCRPHHLEWHRRMDGYRWQAKRAVA